MSHSPSGVPSDSSAPVPNVSAASGNMAALVAAKDWSTTPLGPIEQWPQSLRTIVSLCLASNLPINIAWGPQRVQIYNDGYWPLCGDKHPTSLGQDYKECWGAAWEVLGEAFEQASAGQTRFLENQRMFLDRYGYLEETFFTFSFSPILDESGGVGGLFHPVTELTQQTLAARRLTMLRTVSERTAPARTEQETAALLLETLREFDLDLPFGALYSLAPEAAHAQLQGQVGLDLAGALAPATMTLAEETAGTWPLAEAGRTGHAQRVEHLATRFGAFASGPYPEAPHTALIYSIQLGSTAQPAYFLVLGVSARRALDAEYALFYDLLVAAATTALAKAHALEEERQRTEALAALDRAKTAFFSNISHEFRTSLTLMLGPLEDALRDSAHPLPAAQQARLTLVQRNTLRLQRLVNSLLDFSRIEAGRLQAEFAPLDLAAYTAELAGVFRAALEKAGLALEVDCPPLPAPVYVDASLWEKVVFNLLSNALKFTFAGAVRLRLRQEDGLAVLRVQDTGEGIAATELPKLFSRFYRVEGARSRSHEGSGIGLAFVQELVRLHGGTITAESQPGQGSTFTVRLPLGAAHLPAGQVREAGLARVQAGQGAAFVEESLQWLEDEPALPDDDSPLLPDELLTTDEAATILVVDDNTDMRSYVQRILARQPQWTIRTAADGEQALAALAQQRPDLILSDVMMPRLDGFGLLRALKQHPDTARIPVLLLSARAGEDTTVEGLKKGADDYLAKPFAARELLARVRTQLAITRTRQDNIRLRATEEDLKKFKVLSNHAFDAFILMREDGSFAYLNELARQRWGYTAEEIPLLRVPDVDPIYQEAKFREAFAQAQQRGALPPFETLHRRKDGRTFPVEVSMGCMMLNGQPHMFAIARDITAQVAAKQQQAASEQRYRTLIEESPIATALYLGPEIRIQYASSLMLSYWGKDASVLGQSFRQALPELEDQAFPTLLEQVYATGQPYVGTRQAATLLVAGQPKIAYFSFTYKPLHDEAGQVYGIHHTAVDVTAEVQAQQQIEESEARFRALVEQSPVPIALTRGLDVVVESINAPMLRLMGKQVAEEVLGKAMVEVLPLLESQAILQFAKDVMNTGEPFFGNEVAVLMAAENGEVEKHYYNVSYTPLMEAGQVTGVIHVAIDATEQVRSRQKVESERERARLAIEVGGLGVFESDLTSEDIRVDARFNEIFGFDGPQSRERYRSVLHPDDLALRAHAREQGLKTGSFTYEVRFLHARTGQVRWVKVRGRVYRDAAGELATVLGVAQDTTEQKNYTEALHESEQRFRTLADATPNLVWAVNPDSSIRYINRAFVDFVGVTPAQYEATGWSPYMHPSELAGAQATLTQAISTRTTYLLEHRMRRHDGQYRWLLAQGAPSYYPNGELYGYVGAAIDITDLKQTNEQLLRTNRDLDNFVYTASHDLKAPISNIEGLLRLLEDLLPAELRTDDTLLPVLSRMQDAVERFTRTIGHLTEISKLQLEIGHPATALAPLLEDVRQDLAPLLAATGGQLAADVAACPALLLSEKNLRSLLYNLVSNALKYHHPDRAPVVYVSCYQESGDQVLRVQDNGLGLSQEQQAKLFRLFERLHTHVAGHGVGLYMVKKIVENAGGTLSVQSRAGEGTTFTASFPA